METNRLTLDLVLATHRPEGIARVAQQQLPALDGVRYIISWQDHRNADIPAPLAQRADVEVWRFDGTGLSANRNNAIAHCRADILLFADDDIIYNPEGLQAVIDTFARHPQLDVATFRSVHGDTARFPAQDTKLGRRMPRNYYVTSFEIAFRRSAGLRCCPELGLGSPRLHAGEDEMLLMSAIRRGLDCRYFAVTICEHPGESTGTRSSPSAGILRGMGCLIALTRPGTALLRLPLKAWRMSRHYGVPFFSALWHLTAGALMAPGLLRRNHDTLW